jgi:hypothetical protein
VILGKFPPFFEKEKDKIMSELRRGLETFKPEEADAFYYLEIEKLEKPLKILLSQLKERIDRGEYQLIIGDDASGRIPTFVFDRFLKEFYVEKGYKTPKTIFIAGSRYATIEGRKNKEKKILNYLHYVSQKHFQGGLPVRTLIVTDTIATGSSIEPIVRSLMRKGALFDVATISLIGKGSEIKNIVKNSGGKIFSGGNDVPSIYHKLSMSGVRKEDADLFSKTVREIPGSFFQNDINKSRHDALLLTDKLLRWYREI